MSSLKDSEEQTSPPAILGSLGVQVANSHFSKMSAKRGKSGCLRGGEGGEGSEYLRGGYKREGVLGGEGVSGGGVSIGGRK